MPGLLDVLDRRDRFSFLLGRFGLPGGLDLGLSLGLLLGGFRLLLLGLSGRRRPSCSRGGLGVCRLLGGGGSGGGGGGRKRTSCSGRWLLSLGRLVQRALLAGRAVVTGGARRLVLGGGMRDGHRRLVQAAAGHQPLRLAVETQPLLFLQHTKPTKESLSPSCFALMFSF